MVREELHREGQAIVDELKKQMGELKSLMREMFPSCEIHKVSNLTCDDTNVESITFAKTDGSDNSTTLYLCKSCFQLILKVAEAKRRGEF
jgi:hypothetical protein|tara:strand:+ start:1291 stop:1560 length:270 start_codon:yes stop_codon:yes gene_type:complete